MSEKYPHYLERLQNATQKYWNKPSLNDIGGDTYTFADMARTIEKAHLFFEAAGINKGDHIAICTANGSHFGMAYLAVVTYGAVVVPILYDFTHDAVENLVNHSDAIGLITTSSKWDTLASQNLTALKFSIDSDSWSMLSCNDAVVKEAFETRDKAFAKKYPDGMRPEDVEFYKAPMDEMCMINYTSGSTGNPKGVMLTNRNFSATMDFCQHTMPCGPDDTMVSMLPMAHMYGLVIEFIRPIVEGCAVFWLGKAPTPASLIKAFQEVRPYLLITVPLVIEKIFRAKIKPELGKPIIKVLCAIPGIRQIVFRKIRDGLLQAFGGKCIEFIMGGAALNPEVEKWLVRIKFPYMIGYGMTEANPLLAYEHHECFVPGSCGKPVACCNIRIDSDDPQKVVGEIQAKGDNICIGYYKNPEATSAAFTADGYLRTGDLGIMDKDGNIFIKGRSKSMILGPNGQNIYPEEVEAFVNNQPYVSESVVVDRERKLVALVALDEKSIEGLDKEALAAIPSQIRIGVNRVLPKYSLISKVEIQDKPFEKTPKMSIKRFLYS